MSLEKPLILIIDDERNTREGLRGALADQYDVLLAEDGLRGLALLQQHDVDIVLTDLRMPGMDGMDFTRKVAGMDNPPLIIMLTAYGSVQTAVEAMKVGAYDYLTKPVNLDNLEMMIARGLETLRQRAKAGSEHNSLGSQDGPDGIIGRSKRITAVFTAVRQVAESRSTVLLSGESGTGKELFARAIHQLSSRADKPFIAIHCAALNENLLESELFGHEKGAFTGANERVIGRFEKADGGTLFLDEIGEITPATQVKLLRVLETRNFERVGGGNTITVDVRLIAATNRDLKAMVDAGTFREDLFYRLHVVNIALPPLRERQEDIPLLLDFYLKRTAQENDKVIEGFSPEAVKVLGTYDWPGNVRELRNCVERMVVFARGSTLTLNDVPEDIRQAVGEQLAGANDQSGDTQETATDPLDIKANEKNLIIQALAECGGNRSQAAIKLNISRRTLHRKLKEYGIQ
ncbi:MAG: sigma-54-dependent Fis family transcriptional regulator [Lentisphaerae bacterium]|nr:sigma-54-dependent Fis family transcriptional regulator [Lentisphaerota bacterium]